MELSFVDDELILTLTEDITDHPRSTYLSGNDNISLTCGSNDIVRRVSCPIGECYQKIDIGNAIFVSAEAGIFYCYKEGLIPVVEKLLDLSSDEPKWKIQLVESSQNKEVLPKANSEGKNIHQRQTYQLKFYNSYGSYRCFFTPGFTIQLIDDNKSYDSNLYVRKEIISHITRKYKLVVRNLLGTINSEVKVYDGLNRIHSIPLENKVVQIVPASQDRFVLFGTKISIVQVCVNLSSDSIPDVRRNFNHAAHNPRYMVRILCSSAAPKLGFSFGGYIECNNIVAQCLHSPLGIVRIPLPKCLQ